MEGDEGARLAEKNVYFDDLLNKLVQTSTYLTVIFRCFRHRFGNWPGSVSLSSAKCIFDHDNDPQISTGEKQTK